MTIRSRLGHIHCTYLTSVPRLSSILTSSHKPQSDMAAGTYG